MALLDVNLLDNGTQTINAENGADTDQDNDITITALGSNELIVDGVTANIDSIANIQAGAQPTFSAINDATINLDQGLLGVSLLSSTTYNVGDSSSINLDGSSIGVLGGLSSNTVNFSGTEDGSFTYSIPSSLSALNEVTFDVTGMEEGDSFDITNGADWELADGTNSYDTESGTLSITSDNAIGVGSLAVGTTVNANIAMSPEDAAGYLDGSKSLNGDNGFAFVCFAEGTQITTPEGEVAVEDLSIGDMVVTAEGNTVTVKWVGRQTVRPAKAQDKFQAIRFHENAIAPGLPNQDLTVTASHGMIIDGLVINAGALVNGSTITTVEASELPKEVTYYHIETENHEVILANGAAAETYIDYVDRKAFENYDEYLSLYGMDTTITEMKRPRISARRLLPLAIRERFGIEEPQLATQAA